jgi:AraC-like DNA-binding protein
MENSAYINKAIEFINRSWKDESISLDKIACEAGFSAAYFGRMFTESTGKSVMEYVRIFKLIRSAQMLRQSDKNILDIALELGYANPEN